MGVFVFPIWMGKAREDGVPRLLMLRYAMPNGIRYCDGEPHDEHAFDACHSFRQRGPITVDSPSPLDITLLLLCMSVV